MHVFQPYPIKEIELNPFTAAGDNGLVITAESEGRINAMVSTFVGFGTLWHKKVVFIFVRNGRYTKELLDSAEFFSLSFCEDTYKSSLKYIKSLSGRVEDKIANSGLHINRHIDIPFIDEGTFVVLCAKMASFPVDDTAFINSYEKKKYYPDGDYHCIYVGEILELLAR